MTSEFKQPTLDKSNKVLLGVCAGIAKSFDVPVFWVRVLACIALFTWGLTVVIYLGMYFLMSQAKPSVSGFAQDLGSSRAAQRVKGFKFKKQIYKNPRKGKIKGVCAGLADYFEIPAFFIRIGFLGSLFFGPFAVIAYIVCAFLLDDKPASESVFGDACDYVREKSGWHKKRARHQRNKIDEWEARYGAGASSSSGSSYSKADAKENLSDMDKHFESLEKKLRRIEATITSKKFKLHSELKKMS